MTDIARYRQEQRIPMRFRISVPRKYDLFASIHAWIFPDIQPAPEITSPPLFYRMMTIHNDLVPVIVRQSAPGRPLVIAVESDMCSKDSIKAKIRKTFSLTTDISKALDMIKADSRIASCAEFLSGIRPYLADSPFEALIKSILQQQISYRAANAITKRLVLRLSRPIQIGELHFHSFPTPEAFVSTGVDGLRNYGLGYKAEYVCEVSRQFMTGVLSMNGFERMTEEDIDAVLRPIKGIGDWTIGVFNLAALGRNTAFPYDDLGVQNLLGLLYNNGERMTRQQVIDRAATWGPAGSLVLYLLMCGEVLGMECLKMA